MMFTKLLRHYVSAIDKFLAQFDQTHAPSPSQQAEIDKYRNIAALRDHVVKKPKGAKKKHDDLI